MCHPGLIVLILIASSALLWFGFSGLRNNRVSVKGGYYIERLVSPINYWLNVGIYFVVSIGGFCFSIFAWCMR